MTAPPANPTVAVRDWLRSKPSVTALAPGGVVLELHDQLSYPAVRLLQLPAPELPLYGGEASIPMLLVQFDAWGALARTGDPGGYVGAEALASAVHRALTLAQQGEAADTARLMWAEPQGRPHPRHDTETRRARFVLTASIGLRA